MGHHGTMADRVLVADDDRAIRESLVRALELEGYLVVPAADGATALACARDDPPDAMVLDVMMPSVDGLTVCRVLRAERNRIPILMLTARTETRDRVAGLDAGADDYLPKPFDLDELLARLRALLRRARPDEDHDSGEVSVADLRIDGGARRAWRGERELELSKTEFDLLELLVRQRRHRAGPLDHLRPHLGLRLRPRLQEPRRLHQLPAAQGGDGRRAQAHPHRAGRGLHGAGPMSLRAKLVLALVLLTSMAAISIGIWSYAATSHLLNDQIDQSLDSSASLAGGGRGPLGDRHDGDDVADPARFSDQNVTQVLAADGDRVGGSATVVLPVDDLDRAVAAGALASARRNIRVDGVAYRMLTTSQGAGPGAVQVARSLSETDRVLDSLRNLTIVATTLVVALAAGVGWLIARQVTRRLARLTGVAEEVAATGRLDVPVPVGGSDEAGRLGTAFNEMLTALGRSRDAQQRLVQDAGHELRTPLTSLRTNVSVLRRHETLAPETRTRVIEDLDAETRELTGLVNELVELATDARDDEPAQRVELAPLVERVAERARRRTGRLIAVTADGSVVEGRPQALERAVSNLLDNAAKFDAPDPGQAEGHPPIEVEVAAGRVEVRDRGPGIPDDDLDHVFDRFHRAVGARSRPGSGLGLAIVRDIVESHRGTVSAANRPGGGAVVGFTLPLASPAK